MPETLFDLCHGIPPGKLVCFPKCDPHVMDFGLEILLNWARFSDGAHSILILVGTFGADSTKQNFLSLESETFRRW